MDTSKLCMDCGRPVTEDNGYPQWKERDGTFKGPLHFSKRECLEVLKADYQELLDTCDNHIRERNKLATALQTIALLGDTGSKAFRSRWPINPHHVPGWSVAARMREIALDVVGLDELPEEPTGA